MSTEQRVKEGFLLIADISGYTSFLTGTEFEHAQAITEDLTKLILKHIRAPLKVVKLEGDAVFYYAPRDAFSEGAAILDHIEGCYFDFASYLRDMRRHTTCQCAACSSIETLDLKFFAHYGEYILQKLAGTAEDLAGRDVILLHRLLKNNVTEKTGLRGYALLTEACLERTTRPASIMPHTEEYEHFGEVKCGVHNLRMVEETRRESERVFVEPTETDLIHERIVCATPEQLWSYNLDPQKRLLWQGDMLSVKNSPDSSGRFGLGAEIHCAHGTFSRINRVVDWRPFHYFTVKCEFRPAWKYPPGLATFEFTPIDDERTRVSLRFHSFRRDWFTLHLVRPLAQRLFKRQYDADYDRLDKILAEKQDEV